jgi:hypothetical protein
MKKIFLLLSMLSLTSISFSQDTIFLVNHDTIRCKVSNVSSSKVDYAIVDAKPIRTYTVYKSDVAVIKYESGFTKVINPYINKQKAKADTSQTESMSDEYRNDCVKAKLDADKYYKAPGPSGLTFIVSFLTGGIVGLIPAVAFSQTPPKEQSLFIPGKSSKSNEYVSCYKERAFKSKKRIVWTSYWLGVLSAVVFLVITAK